MSHHDGNDQFLFFIFLFKGTRACGSGGVLCNAPLVQNKGYWEVKVQSLGSFGVGVATRQSKLDVAPLGNDPKSWVLRSDGTTYNKSMQVAACTEGFAVEEGDTIGCVRAVPPFRERGLPDLLSLC